MMTKVSARLGWAAAVSTALLLGGLPARAEDPRPFNYAQIDTTGSTEVEDVIGGVLNAISAPAWTEGPDDEVFSIEGRYLIHFPSLDPARALEVVDRLKDILAHRDPGGPSYHLGKGGLVGFTALSRLDLNAAIVEFKSRRPAAAADEPAVFPDSFLTSLCESVILAPRPN